MNKTAAHRVPARSKSANAIRLAFRDCGYDLDEVMLSTSRPREQADLRTIAWSIYQQELHRTYAQVARAFGWHKATVWCALKRMDSLYQGSKDFRELADKISERYQYHISNDSTA